jgi:Flp pilus assembly protein TadB
MLNQNERRRLEAIERQLEDDDPEFVRRFSHWPQQGATNGQSRLVLVVVLVIASLGVLLAIAAASPALFLGALIVGAAGWLWQRRRNRDGAGPDGGSDAP